MTNGHKAEIVNLGSFEAQTNHGEDETLVFVPHRGDIEMQAIRTNQIVVAQGNAVYTATLKSGDLNVQGTCQ